MSTARGGNAWLTYNQRLVLGQVIFVKPGHVYLPASDENRTVSSLVGARLIRRAAHPTTGVEYSPPRYEATEKGRAAMSVIEAAVAAGEADFRKKHRSHRRRSRR